MKLTIPRTKKCHYKSCKFFGHSFIEVKFTYLMWINTQKIFNFSTTLPTLLFFFLIIAILRGGRWYLLWLWFTFPWWLIMLSIFSYTCWLFLYLLWRNVHSSLWLIFQLGYYGFFLVVVLLLSCGISLYFTNCLFLPVLVVSYPWNHEIMCMYLVRN